MTIQVKISVGENEHNSILVSAVSATVNGGIVNHAQIVNPGEEIVSTVWHQQHLIIEEVEKENS